MSWCLKVSWEARCDLAAAAAELASGCEVGGVVLGDIDYDRQLVTVRQLAFNPEPGEPDSVDVDLTAALEHERLDLEWGGDGLEAGRRHQTVRGVIHSHPSGNRVLSYYDQRVDRDAANRTGEPWVSILLTPGDERWDGGYPAGPESRWEEPCIDAYIAEPGEQAIQRATVIREPQWLWALRSEIEEARYAA